VTGPLAQLEEELKASDHVVKIALVAVAVLAVVLVAQPSRTARLVAALWFLLP